MCVNIFTCICHLHFEANCKLANLAASTMARNCIKCNIFQFIRHLNKRAFVVMNTIFLLNKIHVNLNLNVHGLQLQVRLCQYDHHFVVRKGNTNHYICVYDHNGINIVNLPINHRMEMKCNFICWKK